MPDVDEHARGTGAARDIVARAIDHEMKRLGAGCMFLDISHKPDDFIRPALPDDRMLKLLDLGLVWQEPIPVVPAAHYTCGGVVVIDYGLVPMWSGLILSGEVRNFSGLHGWRMASSSFGRMLSVRAGRSSNGYRQANAFCPAALTSFRTG